MGTPFEITKSGNIVTLTNDEKTIHLIGTAHVSQASIDEVTQFIKDNKPEIVCIELCKNRFDAMQDKDRWKKMDIYKVIKSGKGFFLLTNLMISSFQYKIGKKLGVKPGGEMFAAIEAANSTGSEIVLIDRDIQITLKRTWKNIGFFKKIKLMVSLFTGLAIQEEVDAKEIEKLKTSDMLEDAMKSLGQEIPGLKESLIDERDIYMASHLTDLKGKNIVAVIGAGHSAGMQKHIGKTIDRTPLEIIPPPSKLLKIIKWSIPVIVLGIIFSAWFFGATFDDVKTYLLIWVFVRSVPAAIGVLVAGGRIPTLITAILVAPFTSPIIPILRISIILGLVEAIFRKPKVDDLETLPEAFNTMKSFYKNSVTRILLVAALSGLGSTLGTFAFFYVLASHKEFFDKLLGIL